MLALISRRPERSILLLFGGFIFLGSMLIWGLVTLPTGERIPLEDAFFTATSAFTVTGLTTVSLTEFPFWGRFVVLVLMMIGQVAIVSASIMWGVLFFSGARVASREVGSHLADTQPARFGGVIRFVLIFIPLIWLVSAAAFFFGFSEIPAQERWFFAIFHGVSSVGNVGMTLFPDSFHGYDGSLGVIATVTGFVILGGLGYVVWMEAAERIKAIALRRRPKRLSVQAYLTLITTAALLLISVAIFTLLEWNHAFSGREADSAYLALFQGATSRTAGFAAVPMTSFSDASIVFTLFLMFIGGAPGSAAGGIKVTTFAVVLLALWNLLRGRERVEFRKRVVPEHVVWKAISLSFVAALFAMSAGMLLLAITGGTLRDVAFETISALGNVGLSTGLTNASLSPFAKLVLMLVMVVGRAGPLIFVLALSTPNRKRPRPYLDENVSVG